MKPVSAVICHKEDTLFYRIGLKESVANMKASICSSWCEFSPLSMEIFHIVGDQLKVNQSDFDLQSAALFTLFHNLPTLQLHVRHKSERSNSRSSRIIDIDQPRSSEIIFFEKPRVDYDVTNKVKEP
ncbi:hypothetical protein C5167_024595 [Papaver somniferum]|uniref:Uncharacterized protein n=1 Tax=Papaver somniferum TaxID=3469 RepID=A0A4Y7JSQ5_PAPSO|nr:hypothetical protein C5167_024595 [Papaver somniferum]